MSVEIADNKKIGALWLGDYKAALDEEDLLKRNILTVISVIEDFYGELKYKNEKIFHKIIPI